MLGKIIRKKGGSTYMTKETIYVLQTTSEVYIQQIEQLLNEFDGVERVFIDSSGGEVKVEFNNDKISREQISMFLGENNIILSE
jgi:hypothetical protein